MEAFLRNCIALVLLLSFAQVLRAQDGARYLVIAVDELADAVGPLAEWKHASGMVCKVVRLSEIGSDTASIRNYIVNAYNTWPVRPEFVLLVGSPDALPSFRFSQGSYLYYSDNYYADVYGDFKADLPLGRFPAESPSQCSVMVAKTLAYERWPDVSGGPWMRRLTTIVREDYDPDDTVYWNDAFYWASLASGAGFVSWDSLCRCHGHNADAVVDSVTRGTGLVLYRGTGVANWYAPFAVNPSLTANGTKLPIVISATCATLTLAPGEYMVGDAWVKTGTVAAPRGAVAFFGNTVSATDVARVRGALARGFATGLFTEGRFKLGVAAIRAKLQLITEFPTHYANYRGFNVLGDPDLGIWTETPILPVVTHPSEIDIGPQQLEVNVRRLGLPVEGALVCATMDDEVYVYDSTDSEGGVSLDINPPVTGRLRLVVTGRNCLPYDTVIQVVLLHDVACAGIIEPTGIADSGLVVTPACSLDNCGYRTENYSVRMRIGEGYDHTAAVIDHEPGERLAVTFPDVWVASLRGTAAVSCSTELAGDRVQSNDRAEGAVFVRVLDAEAAAVLAPPETLRTRSPVAPRVVVRNRGNTPVTFDVQFCLSSGYADLEPVDLAPGESSLVVFRDWTPPWGQFTYSCSTRLQGDACPLNDWLGAGVTVLPSWSAGWQEVRSAPGCASPERPLNDGAWLAAGPDREPGTGVIYAAKGNRTPDFLKYYPYDDSWVTLADIDPDENGRTKPPRRGCVGVSDGRRFIYMTKGANTLGFWRYDTQRDTWERLAGVPLGDMNKKVKGGNDLAYVSAQAEADTDQVYLMKGCRNEFYRFNVAANRWDTLDALPYQVAPKYDKGSFLVYDEGRYLYAHQARYTDALKTHHFMFRYDLQAGSWDDTLDGMPVPGMDGGRMRAKRSKEGAAGALDRNSGLLYALKGGNTCMFYRYDPAGDTWAELDTLKSVGSSGEKKKVKAGGDLVSFDGRALFAFKGNKTSEFWRFVCPEGGGSLLEVRSGGRTPNVVSGGRRFTLSPSPVADGWATLRFPVPRPEPLAVGVFDIAGRSVLRLWVPAGRHGIARLDVRALSAGVYMVRVEAGALVERCRLVVAAR